MIRALVGSVLLLWAGILVAVRYFGVVHREQNDRDRALSVREVSLDRRERSLEVWSVELEEVAAIAVARARSLAAAVLLDRALGPAPLQVDESGVPA